MNRVKWYVVAGSAFILLLGFSPIARAELKPADSHAAGAPEATSGESGHLQVSGSSDRFQYQSLLDFLKSKPNGFTEHEVPLGKDQAEEKQISSPDSIKKLQKWVETFQSYRKGLAACEINSDKSAQLLGDLLDQLVSELNRVTSDKAPDWKVSEKKVLTYIVEIERFLKEKKDKYGSDSKDFEKADDALKAQLEKTAELLFGQYHGSQLDIAEEIRKEDAAAQQAKMDQTMKPAPLSSPTPTGDIASLLSKTKSALQSGVAQADKTEGIKAIDDETNKAIAALKLRSGKACVIAAPSEKKDDKKNSAQVGGTDDTNKVADKQKTEEKKADGNNPNLNPAPLQGGNNTGGGNPGGTAPGETPTQSPGTPPPNTSTQTLGGQQGTVQQPPQTTVDTPPQTTAGVDPGAGTNTFDPSGLLQSLGNDFNNKLNDLTNGFGNLFRGLQNGIDDLARQQSQSLNDNNRDDAGLLAALKALTDRNNEQVQPPPPFIPPQISPQVSTQPPPQQPLLPPPTEQPPPPPPPFNPMAMMPPPASPSPAPFYPPDPPRFDDDRYMPPPVIPVTTFDPMQQLYQMMALRSIMQPQYPPGYGPTSNVNQIAALGPRPPYPVTRPGALPMATGFATKAGAAGQLTVPGARTSTLPAALQSMSSVRR